MASARQRIWGWYFFDWASQPYNTLLLTFIFAPYVTQVMGDGTSAQTVWGYGIAAAGLIIAVGSPLLGTIADRAGGRMGFLWAFSAMYVLGAWGIWYAAPDGFNVWLIMLAFGIGLIGMEFATTFTNAMMPSLGTPQQMGRISGSGWAFGYLGGVLALVVMLLFFEDGNAGKTLLGQPPAFGLDPAEREGTRAVGPLTAIWYVVFMIPFFLWVREPRRATDLTVRDAARQAWPDLRQTLRSLPARSSLSAYLMSSMFYRDALNGMYTFGGIYAVGVLGWATRDVGIFGILAAVTGAVFAWIGGRADSRYGPKPVIVTCVLVLTLVALGVVLVSRETVFGMAVTPESNLPDIAFYILGALIGAAGGALQSASRTMMITQSDPDRMTESFGLYALAGKATSFLAPFLIAVSTDISGSQRIGAAPLIGLFLIGLVLLLWVKPNGEQALT
ncbi:MFS transporter [Fertoebacter nigrum]|uniref:MFS transporter n=1 Tax=Fertoeibacter niger TaxID=2656921 RepID=A0A8X8H292_9RHOB|nr:MFS transporter [Fertoeibacter niger]NUB44867.1 MFS transporter [Fertoeibacter niger]